MIKSGKEQNLFFRSPQKQKHNQFGFPLVLSKILFYPLHLSDINTSFSTRYLVKKNLCREETRQASQGVNTTQNSRSQNERAILARK